MKILEPFAGYRLASGHPVFHLAFFTGSWTISLQHATDNRQDDLFAFKMLRWSHLIAFMLFGFSNYCD